MMAATARARVAERVVRVEEAMVRARVAERVVRGEEATVGAHSHTMFLRTEGKCQEFDTSQMARK